MALPSAGMSQHRCAVAHLVLRFALLLRICVASPVQGGAAISKHDHVMRTEKQSELEVHIDSAGHQAKTSSKDRSDNKQGSPTSPTVTEIEMLADDHSTGAEIATKTKVASHGNKSHDPNGDGVNDDNILEVTFTATTTMAPPFCVDHEAEGGFKYCRIKEDHECSSPDRNLSPAEGELQDSMEDCAAMARKQGAKFFVYGKGAKEGKCFEEKTGTDVASCYKVQDAASCCPQTYERDSFDFWIIVDEETLKSSSADKDEETTERTFLQRIKLPQGIAIVVFACLLLGLFIRSRQQGRGPKPGEHEGTEPLQAPTQH